MFFYSLFSLHIFLYSDLPKDQDASNRTNSEHRDEKLERLEAGLASARALIREAMAKSKNRTSDLEDADYIPHGEIYRNAYAFHWYHLKHGLFVQYIFVICLFLAHFMLI